MPQEEKADENGGDIYRPTGFRLKNTSCVIDIKTVKRVENERQDPRDLNEGEFVRQRGWVTVEEHSEWETVDECSKNDDEEGREKEGRVVQSTRSSQTLEHSLGPEKNWKGCRSPQRGPTATAKEKYLPGIPTSVSIG